jgi:hypothetical protein
MSQSQVSINQGYNTGVPSSGSPALQQAPILTELDALEKRLMQLREGVGMLQGRLVGSVAKVRPQDSQSVGNVPSVSNCSAVTNRLAHLSSVVIDIQQTINVLHEDLEL